MEIQAKSIGEAYNFSRGEESDIVEVFASTSGLRIIVSTSKAMFNNVFLEVFFENYRAYRFLDEGDLIAYWESKQFEAPHHVYEITRGGWLSGEPLLPGYLTISGAVEIYREWLVATTNGCITVLSGCEPLLRETKK